MRRIGREANKTKVEKHFHVTVQENGLTWSRREDSIEQEGQFDGIYVMRTSLPSDAMTQHQSVEVYKILANVEHAFRNCKTARLHLRLINVYSEKCVRAHVFLVMLAWYVEWHMRQRLAPILFQDEAPETARAQRSSPVKMAKVSDKAMQKAQKKINEDGLPVHSMATMLADLSTFGINKVYLPKHKDQPFYINTQPTKGQAKALQ